MEPMLRIGDTYSAAGAMARSRARRALVDLATILAHQAELDKDKEGQERCGLTHQNEYAHLHAQTSDASSWSVLVSIDQK